MQFIDHNGSFRLEKPDHYSYLYFPLASEKGLKSSVTPTLGGDAKINQETFLLEPVSAENLHNNRSTRNFWLITEDGTIVSAAGVSAAQESVLYTNEEEENSVEAGFMWHTVRRQLRSVSIRSEITSFIPKDRNVEIMKITLKNTGSADRTLTPFAAVPIYGRSADNLRDHRNVTSMLHRIRTTENSVIVKPTMSFDERGHRVNDTLYYVSGFGPDEEKPAVFYPTVEDFLGEGGTYTHPGAVYQRFPGVPCGSEAEGKEAMGAFRFSPVTLSPDQEITYIILLGAEASETRIDESIALYNNTAKVEQALESLRSYWTEQVNAGFHTSDRQMDLLMKWICFQPFLRRIFGCSFLPHHDYGRGGRGWRDLWQDCLSLLLMDPGNVGDMMKLNFGGVRIDGTNATIIGDGDGNFIADRNGIARVWMDHALWPQMTVKLYIDQTGDVEILNKEVPYFKDSQTARGTAIDEQWTEEAGCCQQTSCDRLYQGSILEHLLIQQLTAFYEVGDHNICRLRGADWNDALDMASEHGESAAFTCAYAGNLRDLAQLLLLLQKKTGMQKVSLLAEIVPLLSDSEEAFENVQTKTALLDQYLHSVCHHVSGERTEISPASLAENLLHKAEWLTEHLRRQEWIDAGPNMGWFNSYYDNHRQKAEGITDTGVRMMLTGQVFSIMGQVASSEEIRKIVACADQYLYRPEIGGYRLNTDFHELKFDLGRMFGFAYGEKENGAVFSHMTVMFANALYRRGFAKEGWKALKTLADACLNFDTSRIYPGIPEYFRRDGRGMYHYLTGAASWFMMTMITEVFGVRGNAGDLELAPQLLREQFDDRHRASVSLTFAGKKLHVIYENKGNKNAGEYRIDTIQLGDETIRTEPSETAVLSRNKIMTLADETTVLVSLK